MPELLWLLLPVAALSGWVIGRRDRRRRQAERELSGDYFQGLNYLLNEQPDKAIEVFTRMVEVDEDTAETHLTLGNLFRRRGEVDRAIRIHQNLIARPSLERTQRGYALLELAKDYMSAGLLDRAESLFTEVVELDEHAETALRQLLDIYQQEKEWDQAIAVAARLQSRSGEDLRPVMAQFACEQAEEALRNHAEPGHVRSLIKRALGYDGQCVRASILRGDLEQREQAWRAAIKAYQRVENQDLDYIPEVLPRLETCYQIQGNEEGFLRYLHHLLNRYPGMSVVMKLSELIQAHEGRQAAVEFMASQLRRRPSVRGLNRLIELNIDDNDPDRRRQRDLRVLQELFTALLGDRMPYRCRECGFEARQLHWQCPSCRQWGTIKPVRGLQGE
ncbi:lipopolysaccharide assembly protein LapB [Sediminicurvatus halobius]|uniref:Lipopolysaccharide assembly protein B n=1 Tax=Sediminicurvatus halobius TaxID=2182432 RepID=A0A2U2N2L3_9GAMM|nr:lipopolysaccharide assembly protein LapB [Spiribacter halobius]PWG63465.1 lipopolysaccharide assembly protein LapB [Spiribacter halobius]UEX79664.1 lipopolysaccharide assembly protein LapB [Spiribacter halobius]